MKEKELKLQSGGAFARISPAHGGRLASLTVDGIEVLVAEGKDLFHWGNFVLAPWVGRMRRGRLGFAGKEYRFPLNGPPHALHGLVTDKAWDVVDQNTVAIDLPDTWPWRGRVEHRIDLRPDGMSFRIELRASQPMPAAVGWHPWFSTWVDTPKGRSGPIELDVHPGRMYHDDAEGLPDGTLVPPVPRPWDYCFVDLAAPPVVRWPGALEITVSSDCAHWVIYDREPQGICVEPWTGPPNGINLPQPAMATPEAPLVATMDWRWRRLG